MCHTRYRERESTCTRWGETVYFTTLCVSKWRGKYENEENPTFKTTLNSINKKIEHNSGWEMKCSTICVYLLSKWMLCKDCIMLRTSRYCKDKTKKNHMDRNPPTHTHNLSFLLHLSSSVGKNIRSCLWCLYFHNLFLLFSFELTCRHFRLSMELCVEPLSDNPASTLSNFWDQPLYFQCVLSSHTHAKDSLLPSPPHLSAPPPSRALVTPQMLGSAILIFSTVCVCSSLSLSRRCTCVWVCVCVSL